MRQVGDDVSGVRCKREGVARWGQLSVLRELRDRSGERPRHRSHADVVALAICRYNLMLKGPAGTGKRWIAAHAAAMLEMLERQSATARGLPRPPGKVLVMTKWFSIGPDGQPRIDPGAVGVGTSQILLASVLIVEHVPLEPHAAAAFFALLDFYCRAERCRLRSDAGASEAHSRGTHPKDLPFGGIQIIATQDDAPATTTTTTTSPPLASASATAHVPAQLITQTSDSATEQTPTQSIWAPTAPSPAPANPQPAPRPTYPAPADGAGGARASSARVSSADDQFGDRGEAADRGNASHIGLMVSSACPPSANPHPDVLVILFR